MMPNYTKNYNLKKPLQEEFYNIDDHNGNMDIIDGELKRIADATPDVSGQIAKHNSDTSAHPDIRNAVKEAKQSAAQAVIDANSYTDQKFSTIPAPDVSGQINAHNTSSTAHSDIRTAIGTVQSKVDNHVGNTNNPHSVTASQVGALPIDGSKPITSKELGLYNGYGSIRSDEDCVRLITKDKQNDNSSIRYIEVLNPSASSEEYCVQLVTIGDPEYGDLSRCLFGEHNLQHTRDVLFNGSAEELSAMATALGAGQIQTGSYKGTGTYGSSNKKSLTFNFTPKLVIITRGTRDAGGRAGALFWTYNSPYYYSPSIASGVSGLYASLSG
jgi:hypothetical protein